MARVHMAAELIRDEEPTGQASPEVYVIIGGGAVEGVYCTDKSAKVTVISNDNLFFGDGEARQAMKAARAELERKYAAGSAHLVY